MEWVGNICQPRLKSIISSNVDPTRLWGGEAYGCSRFSSSQVVWDEVRLCWSAIQLNQMSNEIWFTSKKKALRPANFGHKPKWNSWGKKQEIVPTIKKNYRANNNCFSSTVHVSKKSWVDKKIRRERREIDKKKKHTGEREIQGLYCIFKVYTIVLEVQIILFKPFMVWKGILWR